MPYAPIPNPPRPGSDVTAEEKAANSSAKLVFDLNANYARHMVCGVCDNCVKLKRVARTCIAAISQPGNGDDVRLVWNDMLANYPCITLAKKLAGAASTMQEQGRCSLCGKFRQ